MVMYRHALPRDAASHIDAHGHGGGASEAQTGGATSWLSMVHEMVAAGSESSHSSMSLLFKIKVGIDSWVIRPYLYRHPAHTPPLKQVVLDRILTNSAQVWSTGLEGGQFIPNYRSEFAFDTTAHSRFPARAKPEGFPVGWLP